MNPEPMVPDPMLDDLDFGQGLGGQLPKFGRGYGEFRSDDDDDDDSVVMGRPPPDMDPPVQQDFGGQKPRRDVLRREDPGLMNSGIGDLDNIGGDGGGLPPRRHGRRGPGYPRRPKRDREPRSSHRGKNGFIPDGNNHMMSGANGPGDDRESWESVTDHEPMYGQREYRSILPGFALASH
jgi:hypothetical protein